MDKRPIGYQAGKTYALDKKVPKTNKYDHIESKLTGKIGTTAKDVQIISNKEIAQKKNEPFKRIKATTLWKMINQQNPSESIYNWDKPEDDSVSQVSGLTSITIKTQQLPTGIDTDFLLIDFRDPEDYRKFHIKQALNFPGTYIKQDKWIAQMLQYKNKENKIIVVYHFDEKAGMEYAKELYEKGYDNVYLLSSGIEGFGQTIQDGLEGNNVPVFEKKEEIKMFKKKRQD